VPAAKTLPTGGGYLWSRDEEELVDYETEEPAKFSPVEEDISVVGDDLSAPRYGQTNISPINNDFPAYLAEGINVVAGRKRSQIFWGRKRPTARPAELGQRRKWARLGVSALAALCPPGPHTCL
jgi:hypothetical protein